MLKGIPSILSPELVKTLMEMGHGDEIVLADRNFPAATCGRRLIRADGLMISDLLEAVLPLFPLDTEVPSPAAVMAMPAGQAEPPMWAAFRAILRRHHERFADFDYVERFAYYERAKAGFAVVITGDPTPRGNLLLVKGVVR